MATLPAYDEMWVSPEVVAALSDGTFTYVPVEPWDPEQVYGTCSSVLAGDDFPYGGAIYTAQYGAAAGIDPLADGQTAWVLNGPATTERLILYTATLQATWLLDSLTGYRLHGEECWVEDYAVHTCTITLRRQPVTEITSVIRVRRCNVPGEDIPNWCHKSANQISVCCGGCGFSQFACGCDDNVVRVAYEIGSNLPPGTEALTAWLAIEYGKAAQGKPCALPDRVTSITRQGVSWTVLDPQDFLNQGRTGMARVDAWLSPVKMSLGGQLIDPLTSHRLFSERVDCVETP